MEQLAEYISAPEVRVFIFGVAMIALATCFAIFLIIVATRKSVRSTVDAMSRALDRSRPSPSGEGFSSNLVTRGRGVVRWQPDGLIFVVTKNHFTPSSHHARDLDEQAIDDFRQKLGERGFDVRDVESMPLATTAREDGVEISTSATVFLRNKEMKPILNEACIRTGFRLPRDQDIEIISIEDAERAAGRRAVDDATINAETLARTIGVLPDTLGILAIRIDSASSIDDWDDPSDGGRVVRSAEISWSKLAA